MGCPTPKMGCVWGWYWDYVFTYFEARESLVYPLPAMPGTGLGSWGASLSPNGHLQTVKSLWPRSQKSTDSQEQRLISYSPQSVWIMFPTCLLFSRQILKARVGGGAGDNPGWDRRQRWVEQETVLGPLVLLSHDVKITSPRISTALSSTLGSL